MADDIPQWALDRASELFDNEPFVNSERSLSQFHRAAFARYIAEHEEPPVDPLLIEARKIAADFYADNNDLHSASIIRVGRRDSGPDVQVALAALKRGIELAESGK